jgi:hypothetical protein
MRPNVQLELKNPLDRAYLGFRRGQARLENSPMSYFRMKQLRRIVCTAAIASLAALAFAQLAQGQFGGGGFGGGGFGGGGFGGGGLGGGGFGGGGLGGGGLGGGSPNTIGAGNTSGVQIDAQGVLSLKTFQDPDGRLTRQRFEQGYAALNRNVAKPSVLRKISLKRLERILSQRLAAGEQPDDEMRHLAGLTRIEYVFCYPETAEIVIAGPAEPWADDLTGRTIGLATGRPVMDLEDLAVALRCFPPSGESTQSVVCSIDPTQEGLAGLQQFLSQWGRHANPSQTQTLVHGLQQSMGHQVITVGGVPADTHFAQVMVEADYRMKLIGIGLEKPPVKLISYVERANPAAVSRNALARWYFVPNYDCVRVSDDKLAMQLVGDGVKLVGEDELVGKNGQRTGSGGQSRASEQFTRSFTEKYPELAARSPVYAQLRNCIDMLIAAAFIQQQGYYEQSQWDLGALGDEARYAVRTVNAPQRVASAVNAIWKGARLMTPIGGGVQIHAANALSSDRLMNDAGGELTTVRAGIDLKALPAEQWWWD